MLLGHFGIEMRAVVLILILAILAAIAAVVTGYVNVTNFHGQPPTVTATRNSVTVNGGQPPSFDVQAGSVKVGTKETKVTVPTSVEIRKPGQNQTAVASNNAM
jgi:hypothetical protein